MGATGRRVHPRRMPNGVYPVPKRLSLGLWLRVRVNRLPLDDRLAHGAGPTSSDALALRADQLMRERLELAGMIERALESARRPAPAFSAQAPLRREEIRDCADDLLALAHRLREAVPTDVRGVALASCLLTDGASPLYLERAGSLRYAVRSARLALDPVGVPVAAVPAAA